jgi:hypothetical protein
MTARRRTAVAAAVAVVLAAVLVAAASGRVEGASKLPRGALEDCATASWASFPGAYRSPRSLVVGPLALVGAAGTPEFVPSSTGEHGFQKFPLLVRNGHRVTLALSPATRRGAGLAYGPLPQGETLLQHTHRIVAFSACPRRGAGSASDRGRVTFWSGGVLARSPRCIPLLVWVDEERSPRRAVIRLGVPACG